MIITKERDDKSRKSEFPKLILDSDDITRSEVTKELKKTLTTREIITFLLFCSFFIIIVYMQVSVGTCYSMNNSISTAIANNDQDFTLINIESSYWDWLSQFVNSLYSDVYYPAYEIPANKKHAIPNLNVLVSPVRITQRRMRLVNNTDEYTSAYVSEGWASYGFDYLDEYDGEQETTASFGADYTYQLKDTFYGLGGYLVVLDVLHLD